MKGLRLPLVRRPDPVLTDDELDTIAQLLVDHVRWAQRKRAKQLVSEAIIRTQMEAESALDKIAQVRPTTVRILRDASAPENQPEHTPGEHGKAGRP